MFTKWRKNGSGEPFSGDDGPFSGDEVLTALCGLEWELRDRTANNVAVVFYPEFEETMAFDLDASYFYPDTLFRNTAQRMVHPLLAGKTLRDAVEAQMNEVRDAILRGRADDGWSHVPDEGALP